MLSLVLVVSSLYNGVVRRVWSMPFPFGSELVESYFGPSLPLQLQLV